MVLEILDKAIKWAADNLLLLIIGIPMLIKGLVAGYKYVFGGKEQEEWERMRKELHIKEPTPGT
jgi:hypothetical protein